MSLLLSR